MSGRVPIEQLLSGNRPQSAQPVPPPGAAGMPSPTGVPSPVGMPGPAGATDAGERVILQKLVLALLAIPEVRAEIMLALQRRASAPDQPGGMPLRAQPPAPGGGRFTDALRQMRGEE